MPHCTSSKHSSSLCSSHKRAQAADEIAASRRGCRPRPGSARPGWRRSAARSRPRPPRDRRTATWSKPGDFRAEAVEIFRVAAGRDGRERAAVEGALEGDDVEAVRRSPLAEFHLRAILIVSFQRLGAGIGEEDSVGEGRFGQSAGQASRRRGIWNRFDVCQSFCACCGQGLDQMRMIVAEARHRDAAAEIEIALAGRRNEPGALAALERQLVTRVGRKKSRSHVLYSLSPSARTPRREPIRRCAAGGPENEIAVPRGRRRQARNLGNPGRKVKPVMALRGMRHGSGGRRKHKKHHPPLFAPPRKGLGKTRPATLQLLHAIQRLV